jgi:1,6-anhydro-N-acetylmuramate kinase
LLPADLVVSHGQTAHHWVQDGEAKGTLQLGQPAWIVEATGLPVISDVRARDIAAGGHGPRSPGSSTTCGCGASTRARRSTSAGSRT